VAEYEGKKARSRRRLVSTASRSWRSRLRPGRRTTSTACVHHLRQFNLRRLPARCGRLSDVEGPWAGSEAGHDHWCPTRAEDLRPGPTAPLGEVPGCVTTPPRVDLARAESSPYGAPLDALNGDFNCDVDGEDGHWSGRETSGTAYGRRTVPDGVPPAVRNDVRCGCTSTGSPVVLEVRKPRPRSTGCSNRRAVGRRRRRERGLI